MSQRTVQRLLKLLFLYLVNYIIIVLSQALQQTEQVTVDLLHTYKLEAICIIENLQLPVSGFMRHKI